MAEELFHYREQFTGNVEIEVVAHRVPESDDFPNGIKYSFQAMDRDTGETLLRYDNSNDSHVSRHHKHLEDGTTEEIEDPFAGKDMEKRKEVKEAAEELYKRFKNEVVERYED